MRQMIVSMELKLGKVWTNYLDECLGFDWDIIVGSVSAMYYSLFSCCVVAVIFY